MPSLTMKRGNSGLHVCQNSTVISKNTQSNTPEKFESPVAELDKNRVDACVSGIPEPVAEANKLQEQTLITPHLAKTEDMEVSLVVQSTLQSMFTPSSEAIEVQCESGLDWDAGEMWADFIAKSATDDSDNCNYQAQDIQTCNISDYLISDMIVTGLSFEEFTTYNDNGIPPVNSSADTSLLFDMICQAVEPMCQDSKSSHEAIRGSEESCPYESMDQLRSCSVESDTSLSVNYDQDECTSTSPQCNLASFPDSTSNCLSTISPKTVQKRKNVTLVLDLDETLVHSTFVHRDDSDFSFSVFHETKGFTVYVKQRPYLRVFLEKVAKMFEVVIFTASQSCYAKPLLDILDPDGKIISRRFYRESCIFSNGRYTKDLTIIGVDLAKVAIIDNTPEVFKLQVNNGIPIKSWFDDPLDIDLLCQLPLLESIADAEDVRPIIAKKIGRKLSRTLSI
ncbi:hypothetical protein QQ045_006284 [Rhodiola kirilowii]